MDKQITREDFEAVEEMAMTMGKCKERRTGCKECIACSNSPYCHLFELATILHENNFGKLPSSKVEE